MRWMSAGQHILYDTRTTQPEPAAATKPPPGVTGLTIPDSATSPPRHLPTVCQRCVVPEERRSGSCSGCSRPARPLLVVDWGTGTVAAPDTLEVVLCRQDASQFVTRVNTPGQRSAMEDNEVFEIIKDFLIESCENLARLEQELVELEKRPKDTALLGSIFRTFHTIRYVWLLCTSRRSRQ